MKILGGILIVLGVSMILIRGFNVSVKKKVIDVGPLEVSKTENKWIGWPVYAGGLLTVVGIVFLIVDRKKMA
ncbi:MAG: hypothetical protein INR73_14815 [Williamsia sp.]|nr:hypothetical protein [Williamsia sp.]